MTCPAYLPLSKLQHSQYADLASPSLHFDLENMFAKEYCASLGMSRQVPLRVVGDIGGGGALSRIEKGKKVMKDRKSEWNPEEELPVSATCMSLEQSLTRPRSRFQYRQKTDITRSLPVWFPKNSLQSIILR